MKKLIVLAAVVMAMEVAVSCKDSKNQPTGDGSIVDTLVTDSLASDTIAPQPADSANAQKL